ncbi:MAG: penicillin-binding protein 2 [Rhizobiales bacterium]|nr:penicillin-binding protein 2 [Hyphomicrobiales bacterium]MBI3672880.1 penicillin-binding protein 2 [Hyphomicrobiales bacterium]
MSDIPADSILPEDREPAAPPQLAGQNRIRLIAVGFCAAFLAIAIQLGNLTLIKPRSDQAATPIARNDRPPRPDIVDRNGVLLATDLAVASLYADPRKIIDIDEAVELLTATVPDLNAKLLRSRLSQPGRAFVWLKRQVSPEERDAVYNLGIPGVGFVNERRRVYPQGRLTAHTVGYVDLDTRGIAGLEKFLDDQGALYTASLSESGADTAAPAQMSIDIRVQGALHDEIARAMEQFKAIAGGGVVLDIRTGEVVALTSLPDFNPNQEDKNFSSDQTNRLMSGVYELGSVIKAVTFAMVLDYGVSDFNSLWDARLPLVIGSARITDYHAQRRMLTLPEVFTYSSNIGTARMALATGLERHLEFLRRVGLFDRLTTELPESARPLLPRRWSRLTEATAAFGHGFAVQPLQGAAIVAGLLNGGRLVPPTFLKRSRQEAETFAKTIVKPETSDKLRYLFRLNVQQGTATKADVVGYRVGGKTGTAEKVIDGSYSKTKNLSSFIGAFPMDDPQYLLLVMIDEPQATPETMGFTTAGWNAVPTAAKIIERIAPMLGVRPVLTQDDLDKLAKDAKARKKEG